MGFAYRKRPVEIEAVQYVGTAPDKGLVFENGGEPLPAWLLEAIGRGLIYRTTFGACVVTLEGEMRVPEGHYLIRGVKGELYACDPEIFRLTYEPVPEAVAA